MALFSGVMMGMNMQPGNRVVWRALALYVLWETSLHVTPQHLLSSLNRSHPATVFLRCSYTMPQHT